LRSSETSRSARSGTPQILLLRPTRLCWRGHGKRA
jgi:hypothetical protein